VRRSSAALIGGAVAALVIAGAAAAGPIGRGTPDPWRATTMAKAAEIPALLRRQAERVAPL